MGTRRGLYSYTWTINVASGSVNSCFYFWSVLDRCTWSKYSI